MNNVGSCFSAACDWVRVRRHLAHAGGVLYGMELGSVTLKINTQKQTPLHDLEIPMSVPITFRDQQLITP
jgi:hypothetical protein